VVHPTREDAEQSVQGDAEAARKRSAVELFARHEATLRRTASRYSLCADDVDDVLQRALEILLTKAPSDDQRELIRWTQTVVKHEALSVRRERERLLSGPAARVPEDGEDWVAMLPARGPGPDERVERREAVARSREALQALKPQELRALGLLAEGYSYAEIGEITGFSRTKVNRCLAEGRERFRQVLTRSEDGRRCAEMATLLSAFCDGEARTDEAATLREHLRACSSCRATLRAYRAAPAAVAALAPGLPIQHSLFERAHQALLDTASRFGLGGGATDSTLSQVAAAGGARGAGAAALAKVLAICVGTAGGAAACVATGVLPAPLDLETKAKAPAIERPASDILAAWDGEGTPLPEAIEAPVPESLERGEDPDDADSIQTGPPAEPAPSPVLEEGAPAPEYAPEPAPTVATPVGSAPEPAPATTSGNAAGEFGP
jgi:RNA polymerase sigma factor (sigma-70 family)